MSIAPSGATETSSRIAALAVAQLSASLSRVAFWAAIALPVLYLPLFLAGIDTPADLGVFLGLFALHALALLLGQPHHRTG